MKKNAWFKVCYLNGSPDGIVKCSFDKVGVIGYRIPRGQIAEIKKIEGASKGDLENPGVYVLVGSTVDGKRPIYVGQTAPRKGVDPFYSRLAEHNKIEKRTREWWIYTHGQDLQRKETGVSYEA